MLTRLRIKLRFWWRLHFDYERLMEEVQLAEHSESFWLRQMEEAAEKLYTAGLLNDFRGIQIAQTQYEYARMRYEKDGIFSL